MGLEEILYLRFANAMLEPVWNRNYLVERADHDGGGLRRRGPRSLLRPGRRAARRRRQPSDAGRRGGRDGGALARRPGTIKDSQVALFRAVRQADPAHYVRGQYDGYRSIDGVAADSTTETYAALRLDIENWRWAGVPFFIRTGKRLPVTQTELRLVFRHPPRLGFAVRPRRSSRTSSSSSSTRRPGSGSSSRRIAPTAGAGTIELDMEFALRGRRGTDALRGAAARSAHRRQHSLHAPGRRRGDVADHAAAARRAAAGASRTHRARGGRTKPSRSSPGTAAGTARGSRHDRHRRQPSSRRAQPRRRRSRRSRTTRSSRTATPAR